MSKKDDKKEAKVEKKEVKEEKKVAKKGFSVDARNLTIEQLAKAYEAEKRNLEVTKRRLNLSANAVNEIKGAVTVLEELKKNKEAKLMMPIGAGTFVGVKTEELTKVKISLSNKVIVDLPIDEAVEKLNKRMKNASAERDKLLEKDNALVTNLRAISKALQLKQQQVGKQLKK